MEEEKLVNTDVPPTEQDTGSDNRKPVSDVGSITVEGRVVPDPIRGIYRLRDRGDQWYATVQVEDPLTAKTYVLQNVRLMSNGAPGIQKTHEVEVVSISMRDKRDVANKRVDRMIARPINTRLGTTNEVIPVRTLMRDWRNRFNQARREVCNLKPFDIKEATSKLNLSKNLTVLTDPTNPKAPAVVVDNTNSEIGMYTSKGQSMRVGPDGVVVDATRWDQGTAKKAKNSNSSLGLPSNENDYQDFHPRSTIVNQIPMLIPPYLVDVQRLVVGVSIIYRVARAAKVAVDFIKKKS